MHERRKRGTSGLGRVKRRRPASSGFNFGFLPLAESEEMVAPTAIRFILFSLVVWVAAVLGSPLEPRDSWSDQALDLHSQARAKYGAQPLAWNVWLYTSTLQYAQACKFVYSDGQGDYGENLYATSESNPDGGIQDAMASWMAESSKYDYSNPGFSPATRHFTQVVWKSTTQVACAVAKCYPGTIFPHPSNFVVCRYTPPGNVTGQFPQNVGRPV